MVSFVLVLTLGLIVAPRPTAFVLPPLPAVAAAAAGAVAAPCFLIYMISPYDDTAIYQSHCIM